MKYILVVLALIGSCNGATKESKDGEIAIPSIILQRKKVLDSLVHKEGLIGRIDNHNLVFFYRIPDSFKTASTIELFVDSSRGKIEIEKEQAMFGGTETGLAIHDANSWGGDRRELKKQKRYSTYTEYLEYEYDLINDTFNIVYYSINPAYKDSISPTLRDPYKNVPQRLTIREMDSLLAKWGKRRLDLVEKWKRSN